MGDHSRYVLLMPPSDSPGLVDQGRGDYSNLNGQRQYSDRLLEGAGPVLSSFTSPCNGQ